MDIALHDMSTLLLSIGFIALLLVIPFSIGYYMKRHHANYPLSARTTGVHRYREHYHGTGSRRGH